jgi:hypothetical protein
MSKLSRRDAIKMMGSGGAAIALAAVSMPTLLQAIPTVVAKTNSNIEDSEIDGSKQLGNMGINHKSPLIMLIEDGHIFAFQDNKEFVKVDDGLASKLIQDLVGGGGK